VTESDVTRQSLRTAVAQVCLNIGWTSIHQGPLNILVDVLHKYIQTIGKKSHSRAELYGRTSSNILDLALTFDDLGVNIPDLEEYVQHFEVSTVRDVPKYPAPGQDNLNHLRPGSKEVLHRPIHVYDYLPPMYPEMEEEEEQTARVQDSEELESGSGSQTTVSTPTSKRREPALTPSQSDDGRPLREISSVIMTTGGFLSPCREGKLPERGSRHVVPDPEERRLAARRPLESESDSRDFGVNIKQEPSDIIPPINIKQEVPDEDDMDFEQRMASQEVNSRGKKAAAAGPDIKPRYTTPENIDRVMDAVIERGLKASEKQNKADQSDDEFEPPLDVKPVIKKEDNKKGKKKPNVAVKKPPTESSDLFSSPQHFTANAKTPEKKKMSRIPKITEKVTLPSQSSLMSGMGGALPGLAPNPLIPNFGMNLYGFGNIPASLIPGFNPLAMANAMAMAAASSGGNNSRDSDQSAVTLDDELEEGEISPPDTPTLPARVKTEEGEETSKEEEEKRDEEENLRRDEKEREAQAEMTRMKEREKLEKEREKQREIERQKLLLLSKERERLRKIEEEKEREREREREREMEVEMERSKEKEKTKDPEKEKKKSKKDKKDKDKDREKSKKDKKKEKKEKKKMKEKERKGEEPALFAPVLKIKPVEAAPSSSESPAPAVTPKLVIKNIPKEPPVIKQEPDTIPLLGFQPLRQGPARTPKSTPGKIEKKVKRPSTETPLQGPSSVKKPKIKIRSKEIVEADSGDETPGIITETVGSYLDESGNKVWICPACGKQDDGSPMIGCDKCDDWYHWLCVGINAEPSENQDWFCPRCVTKMQV